MKDEGLLARVRQIMDSEKNPSAAAAKWGLDSSSLAKQLRGERGVSVTTLQAMLKARPDVDAGWLLTGKPSPAPSHTERIRASQRGERDEGLPLLPLGAIAGLPGTDWMDGVRAEDCEYYTVPGLEGRHAELLVRVSGMSMRPTLDDGDVMAVRRLLDRSELSWGRIYVIDSEEGCLVKRLLPSGQKDTILCHSDNPNYSEFTLAHDSIRSLWNVVGLVHGI